MIRSDTKPSLLALDTDQPTNQTRMDDPETTNNTNHAYRKRSPLREQRRGDSYRPQNDGYRQHTFETRSPRYNDHSQRPRSASPNRKAPNELNQRKNKKSHKERKENPSTRIHSLRNLLARGSLPATVHREKERELAALIFEQQKEKIRKDAKKNLARYHFIRFVERQKATRTLKKLKKLQEKGDVSEVLTNQIHEAEVDLNYTLYSPLADKYIAIYARDDNADGKPTVLARNLSRMKKKDRAILSDEQRDQIELASMEAANMLHMADNTGTVKPPMWYTIESKMKEGQKALEALRDEKPKVDNQSELVVGKKAKATPDWLNDDGMINPEDLDSDSEQGGGVAIGAINEDEDMSDGDGGFFEKR